MRLKTLIASIILLLSYGWTAIAQQADNAPQILTSDLVRKQEVEQRSMEVSFVIVDSDNITKAFINDEPQSFEPANTVVITKTLNFKKGENLVKVVAIDEKGNRREKTFLVGYQLSDNMKTADKSAKDSGFFWNLKFGLGYEIDDNPTLDFSSPIDVEGLDIEGVVPDDEQPDSRKTFKTSATIGKGNIVGFIGINKTEYSKSENDFLNSEASYIGAGYRLVLSDVKSLLFNLMLLDINLGGGDYSQNQIFAPAFVSSYKDHEGFYRQLFGLDYSIKDFADSDLDDSSQLSFKWVYNSLDKERLDSFKSLIAYGYGDEGTNESKNRYYSFDFDWKNTWYSGLRWDLGLGFKYYNFENEAAHTSETPFGDKRVDMPLRLSTALGFQFTEDWSAIFGYKYTLNLSNKNIYVRNIYGLSMVGAF